MKEITLLAFILSLLVMDLNAQVLEIEGKAKIAKMDTVTNVPSNVVRQSDGTLALRQYKIGDMAQGGIIFYIDESGEHGLAADIADLSAGMRWYTGTYGATQAKGDGPFAGEMNTAIIISTIAAIGFDGLAYNAAWLCVALETGGYDDWFLPSKHELNLMWENLADSDGDNNNLGPADPNNIGGFATDFYWSSTEYVNFTYAWAQHFSDGGQTNGIKAFSFHVRAVRAF